MNNIARLLPAMLIATAFAVPAHALTQTGIHQGMEMTSSLLEGRQVIGMNGHRLGYVLAVNDHARMVELQTSKGIAVSLPESRLRSSWRGGICANMTRQDLLAMERRQTGRTVATNVDLRRRGRYSAVENVNGAVARADPAAPCFCCENLILPNAKFSVTDAPAWCK